MPTKVVSVSPLTTRASEEDLLLPQPVDNMAHPTNLDSPDAAQHAEEVIQVKPRHRWQGYIWDTFDKSPEERKFLFKLDAAVLTFATLGYFIKYVE